MRLDFWNKDDPPVQQSVLCEMCGKDMHTASSCLPIPIDETGQGRITHGNESGWSLYKMKPTDRCLDCGVEIGGVHHVYCAHEYCSVHNSQLLFCGCLGNTFDDTPEPAQEPQKDSGGRSWFKFW
jgi:hypothetical protein